jgi:hypothetical protein
MPNLTKKNIILLFILQNGLVWSNEAAIYRTTFNLIPGHGRKKLPICFAFFLFIINLTFLLFHNYNNNI